MRGRSGRRSRSASPGSRTAAGSASRVASSFPEEQLIAAGFPRAEVRAYRERVDQIELDRLYLRDRAAREGWLDTPRYARESSTLFRELLGTREEFGDELYDWTLYSSGHPNRVQVSEVMQGSAAESVGLRAGDVVVRYGDQAIFNPMELREATLDGDAGAQTAVEVRRGEELIRVFVPRGPLGVRTDVVTREPTG